jgi:hypothetical protein
VHPFGKAAVNGVQHCLLAIGEETVVIAGFIRPLSRCRKSIRYLVEGRFRIRALVAPGGGRLSCGFLMRTIMAAMIAIAAVTSASAGVRAIQIVPPCTLPPTGPMPLVNVP